MLNGKGMRVLIVQGQMKHYRLSFFDRLHLMLSQDGISLRVAYSDPPRTEEAAGDNCELPAEYGVKVKGIRLCGNRLVWQPLLGEVAAADLVVVEQANKYIMNYLLLLLSASGMKRVAFWGHGRNRQSQKTGVSEWLKKRLLNRVNWWFAYTDGTVEYLVRNGVPSGKTTSVKNTIDTSTFCQELASISSSESAAARKELGIAGDSKVGLYCGRIKREKLPGFLVESAVKIKERLPEFELLAIGGGPEQTHFQQAAAQYSWFHYLGPQFGREKALYFRMSDVFLMPGLVGLAILDAFVSGLPLFTTDIPIHSPEIEYLKNMENGLMTEHDVGRYTQAVVRVMSDCQTLHKLQAGALASASEYSVNGMVTNFHRGILQCLGADARIFTRQTPIVRNEHRTP